MKAFRQNLRAALVLLLTLMLLFGCAAAENVQPESEPRELTLALYSCGALPQAQPLSRFSTRAMDDFPAYMVAQLTAQQSRIDITAYALTPDEFMRKISDLLNSRPELFYIGNTWYYYVADGCVTSVLPDYKYSGADLTARIAAYNAGLARIVAYTDAASTTIGKLMLANDYMCVNFSYDNSLTIYSPDQLLSQKTGVCQAYMLLYRAVLNRLGVSNITATNNNHTWNLVNLDGSWYHIDVTWNDASGGLPLRAGHNNFLLSDARFAQSHAAWSATATATSTRFDDAFWVSISSPIPAVGDALYSLRENDSGLTRSVMKWTGDAATGSELYRFSAFDGGSYSARSALALTGGRVYFSRLNRLYSVDLNGADERLEYLHADTDALIYTLCAQNGALKFYVGQSSEGLVDLTPGQAPGANLSTLTLPETLEEISADAFAGGAFGRVVAGDALAAIGAGAFTDCFSLQLVQLGDGALEIAAGAFDGCESLIFICPDDSPAARYAALNGIAHRAQ